jgi:hypothetical protein
MLTVCDSYNQLPDDDDQPEVQEVHLNELANLLRRYNVQDKFGIHLVHGHLQLEEGKVMLGASLTAVSGCWTKPTKIASVQTAETHGHIFVLTENGAFQAYEYREGPVTDLKDVDSAFFHELVRYLQANHLTTLLGLQVLAKEVPDTMCEFVIENNGTVMLDERAVKGWIPYRTTGYTGGSVPGVLQAGEHHAKTIMNTHKVYVDSEIGMEHVLMDVLRAEDIIA